MLFFKVYNLNPNLELPNRIFTSNLKMTEPRTSNLFHSKPNSEEKGGDESAWFINEPDVPHEEDAHWILISKRSDSPGAAQAEDFVTCHQLFMHKFIYEEKYAIPTVG